MKIITLTLSPAYDVHCKANKITPGEENFITLVERNAGGKGINISRALNSFGVNTCAVTVLGEENCQEYVASAKNEGISLEKILVPGRIRENITIHTDDGEETRISFSAEEIPSGILQSVREITAGLSNGDILTFTGSIPRGVSIQDAKEYIKELKARGVFVIVDSRSLSLSDIAEIKPYFIKPNKLEAENYLGRKIVGEGDACDAARELRATGAENVMLTLGADGAVLATANSCDFSRAPTLSAVSTIGAGDSAIAGFIYADLLGLSKRDALSYSIAFGSAACLRSGTKPPDKSDVQRILEELKQKPAL